MFKIGDMVVWIEDSSDAFTNGKAYKVIDERVIEGSQSVYVKDNNGRVRNRFSKRFKLHEERNMWVCIKEARNAIGVLGKKYEVVRGTPGFLVIKKEDGGEQFVSRNRFIKDGPVVQKAPPPPPINPFVKKLEDKVGKGHEMRAVACYAVFDEDDQYYKEGACHASLRGSKTVKGAATWIASGIVQPAQQATYKEYVNWIVNNSVFSSAFLHDMKIDNMMETGVAVDITQPSSVVYTGCIALRMFHEHTYFREVFCRLYEQGFDMHVCFIVAHGYKNKNYWVGTCDWHGVLDEEVTIEGLKKAFLMKELKVSKGLFNQNSRYEDYYCSRSFSSEGTLLSKIVGNVPSRFKEKINTGWGGLDTKFTINACTAIAVVVTKELS